MDLVLGLLMKLKWIRGGFVGGGGGVGKEGGLRLVVSGVSFKSQSQSFQQETINLNLLNMKLF